jgi:hypothetical protein
MAREKWERDRPRWSPRVSLRRSLATLAEQAQRPAGVSLRRRAGRFSVSFRRGALGLAFLCALLFATSAQAATSHVLSATFGSATSSPANPYPLAGPTDVVVDNSSSPSAHDLYVTDPGIDEQQTITFTATGGIYKLTFRGQTTGQLVPGGSPAALAAALEALSTIGTGNVSVTEPNGPAEPVVTFRGTLGSTDVEQLTLNGSALTGGTATIATTVPGVGGAAVEKFTPAGQFLLIFGKEVNKAAVASPLSTEAERNVCDAGEECQSGAPGTSPGAFEAPTYLAVDGSAGPSAGDVYVADPTTRLVQKFDSSGHIVSSWGEAGQKNGTDTGSAANFKNIWGLAVGATGNLYVLNNPEGEAPPGNFNTNSSVYEFEQNGVHFSTVPIFEPGSFSQMPGLALDSAGNLYTDAEHQVLKYGPNGHSEFIGRLTPPPVATTGYTIDPSDGELYQDTGQEIDHYAADCNPTVGFCTPHDSFGSALLSAAQGVAVDSSSHAVFVADTGSNEVAAFADVRPEVTTGPLLSGTQTSATVSANVDPAGHGEIITCEFEYGRKTTYGSAVPCDQATPYSGEVTATILGLPPGFHGHYRVVVSNAAGGTAEGADEPFTVAEPPSINGLEAVNVTSTSAELVARINPDDLATSFRFEYGTTTAYGQMQPSPDAAIETELGRDHTVTVQLTGLSPNLVYHYRFFAENEAGPTASEDQTFSFYPSGCPNATLRQQTGSDGLPDCRAYELVTPASSGNALIFPADATPNTGLATTPSRLAYGTWGGIIPGTGDPINTAGDMYVATRTDGGWVSRYIGLPADQAAQMGSPPWTARIGGEITQPSQVNRGTLANQSLSKVVNWNDGQYETKGFLGEGEGVGSSNAPYVWDSTSGSLIERWPTGLGEVSGGEEFKGQTAASADLTHFVFSSNVTFPSGAAPGEIYDDNTTTGTLAVVSVNAHEESVKAVPAKVSADGSHILMSSAPSLAEPTTLYMRVDDQRTYDIAPRKSISYVGMTSDGSRVLFTSPNQLTSEDKDTSTDLYMWSEKGEEEGKPLTLISKGETDIAGQPGNTDECSPALITEGGAEVPWTSKCDVATISFAEESRLQGGLGGNGYTDSSIAAANGDVYFFSPEQLLADKGIPGEENLYLYRDGALQFVASLTPGFVCTNNGSEGVCARGPIVRMDVSPDGSHMAFIAASRVTSYDNAGHTEMYSYAPSTGTLTCDSCLPSGRPPTSEVYASQNGLFMADDGRAFFSTEDALVPRDTNHGEDVYEFVGGRPQLISGGTGAGTGGQESGFIGSQTRPGLVAVSADGRDAYFATVEILVRQDENGEAIKIYDARTDGGFPSAASPPPCAAADECHGPGSSPPTTPATGTGAELGNGGNLVSDPHRKHHKKKAKRHHRKPTAKRHHRAADRHGRGGNK